MKGAARIDVEIWHPLVGHHGSWTITALRHLSGSGVMISLCTLTVGYGDLIAQHTSPSPQPSPAGRGGFRLYPPLTGGIRASSSPSLRTPLNSTYSLLTAAMRLVGAVHCRGPMRWASSIASATVAPSSSSTDRSPVPALSRSPAKSLMAIFMAWEVSLGVQRTL